MEDKKINKFKINYKHYFKSYNDTLHESFYKLGYESKHRIIDGLIDDIDSLILLREENFSKTQKRETIRTKIFFEKLKQKASTKLIELEFKLNNNETNSTQTRRDLSLPENFKSLFEDSEEYKNLINILIKNNVITKRNNGTFKWVLKSYTETKAITALCIVLKNKKKFTSKPKPVRIGKKAEKEFGVTLSNYSRYANAFIKDYENIQKNENKRYLDFFKKII